MITLSEMQALEIIAVEDGSRLGNVLDLEIDADRGQITALVVAEQSGGGFFKKQEERLIQWEHILKIGSDVILVKTES
ncbi:YlmC/YmxH family sporulation protein [Aciduricibacillus chroicocephali]|uniref:YlmC/YmxH family sporulation protein n=1 Tax=Aciduricibacillus chroicocephali TaxID=3054939 RepID=A0ABY9KY54_9BACI|nr:YlmC/YmxH family sporulation protein [Bacillaceae bacterium 44XB]